MGDRKGGDVFRSAPVSLVQLYIPREIAREAVATLGSRGTIHLRDLNINSTLLQRPFVFEVRRIEEALGIVAALEATLDSCHVLERYSPPSLDVVTSLLHEPLGSAADIDELIDHISSVTQKINHLAESRASLERSRDGFLEKRAILNSAGTFFGEKKSQSIFNNTTSPDSQSASQMSEAEALLRDADVDDPLELEEVLVGADRTTDGPSEYRAYSPSMIGDVLGGSIFESRYMAFERLCWRAARGNLVMSRYPVEHDPSKVVFIIYSRGRATASKIRKIAEAMDACLLSVSSDPRERSSNVASVNDQLAETFTVLDSTTETLQLEALLVIDQITPWKAVLLKEQLVYIGLNRFDYDNGRTTLIGEGWVPTEDISELKDLLHHLAQGLVIHEIKTNRTPPTLHRTNKLTAAFQAMVDVYGIARYQEVNAALPTVITFPFMFAIMFGDVGHATILLVAAAGLCIFERRIQSIRRDEVFDMAYSGRYVLLLMALFSLYTGFLYNDIFSRSMTIFNSGWKWPKVAEKGESVTASFKHAYAFGLDSAWHGAENALSFTNSYKMKLSVLMGFAHMTYSLMFSLINAWHFHSWVDVWGNFVPGFLFMQSIFGYLSVSIVYKWCIDWTGKDREPPSLLNMLINMFLSPGKIEASLYAGQAYVQIVLVLIALVCIPWLLIFKPWYLNRMNKMAVENGFTSLYEQSQQDAVFIIEEDAGEDMIVHEGGQVDENVSDESSTDDTTDMGEVIVHQVIHTIEFCLNCVSHTASYLRLWALSLAHNQLSTVLWNMTLQNAFGLTGATGVVATVFLFGMWFVITVMVLVCMEGTSAMLHALRLHWVEAMSKHFEGEGYAFEAFSFAALESKL